MRSLGSLLAKMEMLLTALKEVDQECIQRNHTDGVIEVELDLGK